MSVLTPIKTYRLRANGRNGTVLTVPEEWMRESGLTNTARVLVQKDEDGRLVISAIEKSVLGAQV